MTYNTTIDGGDNAADAKDNDKNDQDDLETGIAMGKADADSDDKDDKKD